RRGGRMYAGRTYTAVYVGRTGPGQVHVATSLDGHPPCGLRVSGRSCRECGRPPDAAASRLRDNSEWRLLWAPRFLEHEHVVAHPPPEVKSREFVGRLLANGLCCRDELR